MWGPEQEHHLIRSARPQRKPRTVESDHLDGAGLGALLSLNDLELDLGALVEDSASDVVGVNEYVLAATLRRDEPKTLGNVEKLDRTFLHLCSPFSVLSFPRWEGRS